MDVLSTFDPSYLSTLFTFKETIGNLVANTPQNVLAQNPLRVAFQLTINGLSFIRPGIKNAGNNVGIMVPSGQSYNIFSFRDYPSVIGQPWSLFSGTAVPFYILEIIYLPPSE